MEKDLIKFTLFFLGFAMILILGYLAFKNPLVILFCGASFIAGWGYRKTYGDMKEHTKSTDKETE